MFGWFRKRRRRLQPEAAWIVAASADELHATDPAGMTKSVARADLAKVLIDTNDSGPWGADLWWLMFGLDGKLVCAFPQGATGERAALDYLMALPGFDLEQMGRAMQSTGNAVFLVWSRP